jgi:hypothetical protein
MQSGIKGRPKMKIWFWNGADHVTHEGTVVRSGAGHGTGPEYGMLYRLADGRYLGGVRHTDRGDLMTEIRYAKTARGAMPARWRERPSYCYFRVCPRGFANEVLYFRVPASKVAEVDTAFEHHEDNNPNGSSRWIGPKEKSIARKPGVAIDWADRAHVGF